MRRKAFVAEYAPSRRWCDGVEARYSSLTRPTFRRMRTCGASGCREENRRWWTPPAHAVARRNVTPYLIRGQLLLGGVPGNWRGGGDGTGGQHSNSATSAAFLRLLRDRHTEPLTVIWDNSPVHRGDALRAYPVSSTGQALATPGLRLVNPVSSTGQALPSYSPDFNADEAIWALGPSGGDRQPVPGYPCRSAREGGRLFRSRVPGGGVKGSV